MGNNFDNKEIHEENYDSIFSDRCQVHDSIIIGTRNLHLDNWFSYFDCRSSFISDHHLDDKIYNRDQPEQERVSRLFFVPLNTI